jgi:hypothetical protein
VDRAAKRAAQGYPKELFALCTLEPVTAAIERQGKKSAAIFPPTSRHQYAADLTQIALRPLLQLPGNVYLAPKSAKRDSMALRIFLGRRS